MTFLQALVLGVVQGLTEFLPVSSSGHLVLADALLGVEASGVLVVVVLHVATLLAVCWVYRSRLAALASGTVRGDRESIRYIALLGLASVPAGVVGFFFLDYVGPAFERPVLAAAMLLVTGVAVWSLKWSAARSSHRSEIRAGDAVGAGLAQALALLPGISRSGSTVAVGTALGVAPSRMAEFSFLMSVPAIAAAALLQLDELSATGAAIGFGPLAVAFAAALGSGVLAIRLFVAMLASRIFHRFAYYCWAVGAAYLIAAWFAPGLR